MRYHTLDIATAPRTRAPYSDQAERRDAVDDEGASFPAYAGGGFARAAVIRRDSCPKERREGARILFDGTFTYL